MLINKILRYDIIYRFPSRSLRKTRNRGTRSRTTDRMGQNLAHPVCRIPSPDEPCSKQRITRKGKNHFGGSPFHVMQSGVTLAISFL